MLHLFRTLVPGSLQILVSLFFVFSKLGCLIFFMMVSVSKARQARLLKNVNKHFHDFISQNQRITKKRKWDEKLIEFGTYISIFVCHDIHHNCVIVSVKGIYRVEEEKWSTLELIGVDFTSIFFD